MNTKPCPHWIAESDTTTSISCNTTQRCTESQKRISDSLAVTSATNVKFLIIVGKCYMESIGSNARLFSTSSYYYFCTRYPVKQRNTKIAYFHLKALLLHYQKSHKTPVKMLRLTVSKCMQQTHCQPLCKWGW